MSSAAEKVVAACMEMMRKEQKLFCHTSTVKMVKDAGGEPDNEGRLVLQRKMSLSSERY